MRETLINLLSSLSQDEQEAIELIVQEYLRATGKHPEWPKDVIHMAAIVSEESGELIRAAIQLAYENGSRDDVSTEAIQTGAMALRFLVAFSAAIPKEPPHRCSMKPLPSPKVQANFGDTQRILSDYLLKNMETDAKWFLPESESPNPNSLQKDNGQGNPCAECKKRPATIDYNGHNHMVCRPCYERLNNEFDEEYR